MRFAHAALFIAGSAMPALGQHEPVIVVPGRPDVPVYLNGYDVSGAVVEGDWGLNRPGHMAPIIVDGPLLPGPYPSRGYLIYGRGYYPGSGRRPGYGRYEVQPPPNRTLPPPAPSYHREWGAESAPLPVTEYPPYETPSVIVAPGDRRRGLDDGADNGQPGLDGSQGGGQRGFDNNRGDGRHGLNRDHGDGHPDSAHNGRDGKNGFGRDHGDGHADSVRDRRDGQHGFDRTHAEGRPASVRDRRGVPRGLDRFHGNTKLRMPHHVR